MRPIPKINKEDINRFWNKVKITANINLCWIWTAAKTRGEYGVFHIKRYMYRVSRVSYYLTTGFDPSGYQICHTCDNPSCVNPNHLFLGTPLDNVLDMMKKGRHSIDVYGERHGRSILTEKKVKKIRELYKTGRFYQTEIAKKFKVNKSTISMIILNKNWKHLI